MVFSTNQVRHILAANEDKEVGVVAIIPGENGPDDGTIYFLQVNGTTNTIISRSDIIPIENIISISVYAPTSPFKKVTITTAEDAAITADDYLKVRIFDSPGSTNPIIHYIKPDKASKLGLVWNATNKTLSQDAPGSTAGAKDGIIYFDVEVVDKDLKPKEGMTYTEGNSNTFPAYGLLLLEKFCNSFKGPMEFGVGYPYASQELPTYVNPTNAYPYVMNIHYYYSGSNEASQKSEKDLTIFGFDKMQASFINGLLELNPSIKFFGDKNFGAV